MNNKQQQHHHHYQQTLIALSNDRMTYIGNMPSLPHNISHQQCNWIVPMLTHCSEECGPTKKNDISIDFHLNIWPLYQKKTFESSLVQNSVVSPLLSPRTSTLDTTLTAHSNIFRVCLFVWDNSLFFLLWKNPIQNLKTGQNT